MKITGLETFQIPQFPLSLFLRVHTDEGLVGLGESTNQPDAIEGAVHGFLAPRVLGREAEDIEALWNELYAATNYQGSAGAELPGPERAGHRPVGFEGKRTANPYTACSAARCGPA